MSDRNDPSWRAAWRSAFRGAHSQRYDIMEMLSDVTWRARVAREERERRRRDRIKAVVLFVVSTLFVLVVRYIG